MKPIIQYSDLGRCVVGESAHVFLRDHHTAHILAGGEWLFTSAVQSIVRNTGNGPVFETRNTLYTPYDAPFFEPPVKKDSTLLGLSKMLESA